MVSNNRIQLVPLFAIHPKKLYNLCTCTTLLANSPGVFLLFSMSSLSFFPSDTDKFVLANGSEVSLFQLEKQDLPELIYDEPQTQNISKI